MVPLLPSSREPGEVYFPLYSHSLPVCPSLLFFSLREAVYLCMESVLLAGYRVLYTC